MTVTIVGTNYSQISSFDTDITGGSWAGQAPAEDTVNYKEGAGSMSFIMKAGTELTVFTPTSSIDLSGTKHVRFWFLATHGGDFSTLELGVDDGVDTGFWQVSSLAEYAGGWHQCIIDVSKAVDSGTKPSAMNAITDFHFRAVFSGGKNVANFWLDNLIYCDGLTAYGDDGGSEFDFDDIFTTGISEGSGIISSYNGVYYLTGSLTIGDGAGTSSSDFIAKNQTVVFVDRSDYISSSLYAINVVGNATGITQRFELGENSGGKGISGCVILCTDTTLAFEFTVTDTDVDDFGLYGSTFNTYGTIDLQPDGASLEVLNCNFVNGVGQIQPNTMDFSYNFIISGTSTDGSVLFESTSHSMTYNNYINCSRATEFAVADTYGVIGDQFSGNTYDVHFSAGSGNLIINAGGTPPANPSPAKVENDSSGTVTINNTVTITITVKDAGGTEIENVRVFMEADTGGDLPSHEAIVGITRSGSTCTVDHTGHGLASGQKVNIEGANEHDYNGVHTITVTGVDDYEYTIAGTPDSPATGTLTCTFVMVEELTNVSGIATEEFDYSSEQPFNAWARKSSGSPYYKTTQFTGSITSSGYTATVTLASDE